jgi:hypothetical protein
MKENTEPSNSGKEGYDPFAPENVRLDQSELDRPAVKPELTSLPVRKPEKFEFIRVCPDPDFRFGPISFIEIKRSREYYLVPPQFKGNLAPREYWIGYVFLATNTLEKPFLWIVKLQSATGRVSDWYTSELECAERAMKEWLQVVSDTDAGVYTVSLAQDNLGEPGYPDKTPAEILRLGFKRRLVDSLEHPVFSQLRGKKS